MLYISLFKFKNIDFMSEKEFGSHIDIFGMTIYLANCNNSGNRTKHLNI